MKTKNKTTSSLDSPSSLWNVLIAEDDFKVYEQLIKDLRHLARCTIAQNGEETLLSYQKAIKEKKPFGFILLDVTMPKKNGFEVLKTIRAQEEAASRPPCRIIMITTFKDSLMEIYNMGWDEYITKPVDGKKLVALMKKMV